MQSGKRRRCAFTVCLCTFALLADISCESPQKTQQPTTTLKPINVVFITLDTVRADHLHCYGNDKIKTPTIDGLAARGVVFDKAVTQAPLTLPSHASMFTGTNPNVHNVRDTGGFALQSSSVTLAKILQNHGWNTAAFVSAFVFKRIVGFDQGFSVYDDRMPGGPNGESAQRPASITVDHAMEWLNAQSKQPFLIWLHFYDAHQPFLLPPATFREQYPGNTYDAEIAYIDQQLGRFLGAVNAKSPAHNTLIVLLSDHGEDLGQHGEYHHGIFLYDNTVRVAWIMAGPDVPAGIRVQQQARTIDVLPTVLNLLGAKADFVVQGTSMVPAFSGKQVPSTYSYEETLFPKFMMNWAALRGIHTADWMYVRAPRPELYDLQKDPGELHNVIDTHPREYRELEKQLKLLSRTGNDEKEKIVSNQMDRQTMERLRSLGYTGGTSRQEIELDNAGTDPKDRLDILKLLHMANDPPPGDLPTSRRIKLLEEALAKDPTNPSIYYSLSDAYDRTGQADENLQLCLDALHRGIRGPLILSRLGQLYLSKGDMHQAIVYYGQELKLDPLSISARNGLATAYSHSGRLAEAQQEFQRVLSIQQYIPAYDGLGLVAVRQHDFIGARKNFERAIQLDPSYAPAQLNLGVLCMQTGDVPCARAAFRVFLAQASPTQYGDMIPKVHNALNTVLAQK